MTITNIKESIGFTGAQMLSQRISQDDKLLVLFRKVEELKKGNDFEAVAKVKDEIKSLMPTWMANDCEKLGIEDPTDQVFLEISLGDVLFELYSHALIMPQAPLARALQTKKAGEFADVLSKPTFDLPKEMKPLVEKTLTNDELWARFTVSAFYYKNELERGVISLNNEGLFQFKKIMSAVLKLFLEEK